MKSWISFVGIKVKKILFDTENLNFLPKHVGITQGIAIFAL